MIDSSITVSLSLSHNSELALELSGALFRGIILPLPTPWNSWISMQTPQAGLYLHRGSAQALAPRSAWKKGKWNTGKQHNIPKKTRINPNHTKPSKSKKSQDQPQPKFPSPAPQTQGQREPDLKISFCPRVRNHPPQFPAQFLPFQDIGWEGLCTDVRHWIFFNPQVVLFQPLGCCGWCSLIAVVAHLIKKLINKTLTDPELHGHCSRFVQNSLYGLDLKYKLNYLGF